MIERIEGMSDTEGGRIDQVFYRVELGCLLGQEGGCEQRFRDENVDRKIALDRVSEQMMHHIIDPDSSQLHRRHMSALIDYIDTAGNIYRVSRSVVDHVEGA